jgi:glycosyltransferase AglD
MSKVLITIPCRNLDEVSKEAVGHIQALDTAMALFGVFCSFDFPTDKGYGNAILHSWRNNQNYDAYVIWDNDFAVPIAYVSELLGKVENGYDVVVGARQGRTQKSSISQMLRGLFSTSFNRILSLIFLTHLTEHYSGFRAYSSRFVVESLEILDEPHWGFQPESVIAGVKLGYNVCEVPVPYDTSVRPTPIKRIAKDMADIIPTTLRLVRAWK